MPDTLYPYQPGGYQPPPSPVVHAITDAAPSQHPALASTAGAAVGQGPNPFVRALPAIGSLAPLAAGRLWYLHGGHSIAAWGVGGLGAAGVALAFANRSDSEASKLFAAASALVIEFAIDAYAPELALPGGLAALTLVGAYTAAARAWRKTARAAGKHAERKELKALESGTTIQVEQIRAQRDIAVAMIHANAAVRQVEIQATAITAAISPSPYPLLELSPQAKAMLERKSDLALEPARDQNTAQPGRPHASPEIHGGTAA
jgi:hypothetical protein